MKSWTIGKRIIANSAALLALVLLVSAIGINTIKNIENLVVRRLQNDAIPGINSMSSIIENMMAAQVCTLSVGNASDPAQRDKLIAELATIVASANDSYKAYEEAITAPEDRANFEELSKRRMANRTARSKYIELIKAGQNAEADTLANGELGQLSTAYRTQAHLMLEWNQATANKATGEVIGLAANGVRLSLFVSAFALAVGVILAAIIIRGLNRALRGLSLHLDDSASQVASAAGQVSRSSQSLAEGSSQQAASLEETSASLEELTSMTKRNAESAVTAKNLSGETRQAAEQGNNDMGEMREAMDSIKSSSADIAKIIKTIDEIAFQTNILALNAAVEAARAGEAGMGFAVVAEEVRALAQRSAHSAKETASKIEVAIHNSEHGAQISEKVATSLGVIVGKARRVDELISEIATASSEQSQGITQINTAISQMDKVTQSNASNAEETAAAAEELNAQSAVLKDSVTDLQRLVGGGAAASAGHLRPVSSAPKAPAHVAHAPTPAAQPTTLGGQPAKPTTLRAPVLHASDSHHDLNFKDV